MADETSDEVDKIPKKRKQVTTESMLENFLLLGTSLDDTVREDAVLRAFGEDTSKTKGKKAREAKLSEYQAQLVNALNSQRQSVRAEVAAAIKTYAAAYDARSIELGELDTSGYEYDPDEQENLAKERWTVEDAIDNLQQLEAELEGECADLGRKIRKQQKDLQSAADELVEQRGAKRKKV